MRSKSRRRDTKEELDVITPHARARALTESLHITFSRSCALPLPAADRTRARICAGCSRTIADPYVLYAIDRFWHHACLQCHFCGVLLANSGRTCFFRDGRLLCRDDYIRQGLSVGREIENSKIDLVSRPFYCVLCGYFCLTR